MDYGRLISDAWRIAWRFKYLWILGLFAAEGGGCGGTFGYSSGTSELPSWVSGLRPGAASDLERWVGDHWAFLGALILGAIVLGLVLMVVSTIATAALVGGVDEAASGWPGARLGSAWHRGVRSFWRLLGMWLLVGLTAVVAMTVVVLLVAVPVAALAPDSRGGSGAAIALLVVSVLLLLVVLVPVAIALSIVLQWSTRSLVLEGTGVIGSLGAGFRLLRTNVGASILVWLLNVVLSIAVGIAITVVVALTGIPAAVLVASSWGDIGAPVLAVLGLLGFVVLAALIAIRAVSTTYFSAYWTLAYRRLTVPRMPAPAAAGAPWGESGAALWPPQQQPVAPPWSPPPTRPLAQSWPPPAPTPFPGPPTPTEPSVPPGSTGEQRD